MYVYVCMFLCRNISGDLDVVIDPPAVDPLHVRARVGTAGEAARGFTHIRG